MRERGRTRLLLRKVIRALVLWLVIAVVGRTAVGHWSPKILFYAGATLVVVVATHMLSSRPAGSLGRQMATRDLLAADPGGQAPARHLRTAMNFGVLTAAAALTFLVAVAAGPYLWTAPWVGTLVSMTAGGVAAFALLAAIAALRGARAAQRERR